MTYPCKKCDRSAAYVFLPKGDSLWLPTYWCGGCWVRAFGEPPTAQELASGTRLRRADRRRGGQPANEGGGGAGPDRRGR